MNLKSNQKTGLVLAGGSGLAAYQAGAYEAMHERGCLPDLISGASAGALNGAIIAGNPPERRMEKLREFWRQATIGSALGGAPPGGRPRELYNRMHVLQTLLMGRPGLFSPRVPGMMSMLPGVPPDVAMFDTRPLISTLERVVDFDLLNEARVPLVVNAVDVDNGEPVRFDSRRQRIEPEHLLASTALAPAFQPVEIDGRCLVDPGLDCNLPIDAVLEESRDDLLCIAVDLFDSVGQRPVSLDTAVERAQDLAFSSQSLRAIDARVCEHRLRRVIHELTAELPKNRQRELAALSDEGRASALAILLISYRPPLHEQAAKTFDFSRASIEERWALGRADMAAGLDLFESGRATHERHGCSFYDGRRVQAPSTGRAKGKDSSSASEPPVSRAPPDVPTSG
jgi:NTE family protein